MGEKTGRFQLTYQQHSSSTNCTKELFKLSKDSVSLKSAMKKNFGFGFFVSDVISKVGFWSCVAAGT